MATYRDFENKLLEKYKDEVLFIELKPGKAWRIGNYTWPNDVPIPVYTHALADTIKKDDIECIPPIALLKGLVFAVGAMGESIQHFETYQACLEAFDEAFHRSILQDGVRLAQEGDLVQAILYFRVATLTRPERIDGWVNRGRAYYDLAEAKENKTFYLSAEHNLKKAIAVDEDHGMAYYLLGYCYYSLERYREASMVWKQAFTKGLAQEVKEELVEALAKMEVHLVYEEGVEHILSERVDEGLALLKSIEDEHDDWWSLLFYIGLGLRFQELYEDAIGYFLKVLLLNTGDVQTMNELGLCFLSIGDVESAERYYKEALKISPENAEILCNLGIVFLNRDDVEAALSYFNRAQALKPEDEVIQSWIQHVQMTRLN